LLKLPLSDLPTICANHRDFCNLTIHSSSARLTKPESTALPGGQEKQRQAEVLPVLFYPIRTKHSLL
jgi:hypothetical protein